MNIAKTYKALGDPIRLKMIKRLVITHSLTIGEISNNLGITRQGARKQLQVLVSANLVTLKAKGRETTVTLCPSALQKAKAFITELENQWDNRLKALKNCIESKSKN